MKGGHQYPLTKLGVIEGRGSKAWWRCERCGGEYTESSPTVRMDVPCVSPELLRVLSRMGHGGGKHD